MLGGACGERVKTFQRPVERVLGWLAGWRANRITVVMFGRLFCRRGGVVVFKGPVIYPFEQPCMINYPEKLSRIKKIRIFSPVLTAFHGILQTQTTLFLEGDKRNELD